MKTSHTMSTSWRVCLTATLVFCLQCHWTLCDQQETEDLSDDRQLSFRDRRSISGQQSFWKRFQDMEPDVDGLNGGDHVASFWKRYRPVGGRISGGESAFWKRRIPQSNNAFWKRRGAGSASFWKRMEPWNEEDALVPEIVEDGFRANDGEEELMKKNTGVVEQRRGQEMAAARRPEFNPTGW